MSHLRLLFLIISVILSATQAEGKKTKLVYKLNPGDQYKIEVIMKQEVVQELMGQSQDMNTDLASVYDIRVSSVTPEGNFKMELKLLQYSMSASNPMAELKYNSAEDEEVPDYAKPVSATLNEVFTFILAPDGKVSEVAAPEGLEEKVQKLTEELMQGDMQMFAGLAGNMGSVDTMKKAIEGIFMKFPPNPVNLDETWSDQDKLEQIIPFQMKADYKLVKSSKESNELHLAVQITQADPSAMMEMEGMTIQYELAGAKSGTFLLDTKTGIIRSGEAVTMISGVISLESPQIPAPMTIPMTIKVTETTRQL